MTQISNSSKRNTEYRKTYVNNKQYLTRILKLHKSSVLVSCIFYCRVRDVEFYLQNVFRRLFLIFADPERKKVAHPECMNFLERVLEIVDAQVPVDCPRLKLTVNKIEQRLSTELFNGLVGVET